MERMSEPVAILILTATLGVLGLLLPFAMHRSWLLLWASRRKAGTGGGWEGPLPLVTVQLPVFNEAGVVGRLIDAVALADYPEHLLEIQVLDDSTDATVRKARERVQHWREQGVDIHHLRRGSRTGFKAGALAWGHQRAHGDFLVVLDADFVPAPDMIRRLLDGFTEPRIGMVQARWDHLNEAQTALTRAQALLLDGHFFFEQGGRHAAGRFFNFNGTAGMWRRSCLQEAGGWSAETLTEDLDLSYRAQMAGWRFNFLPDYGVPAELPPDVGALEVQQKRWAQGGVQTARKILPGLLRSNLPAGIKTEAVIHLLGHLAHPLTLALGLLLYPSAVARRALGLHHFLWLDLVVFGLATGPFLLFYARAGRKRHRPWRDVVPSVLLTLAAGIGLTAAVSRAVLRGLRSTDDPFVRTPKQGVGPLRYRAGAATVDWVLKLVLAGLLTWSLASAVQAGMYASVPFLLLFLSGYLWFGIGQLLSLRLPPRDAVTEPLADGADYSRPAYGLQRLAGAADPG